MNRASMDHSSDSKATGKTAAADGENLINLLLFRLLLAIAMVCASLYNWVCVCLHASETFQFHSHGAGGNRFQLSLGVCLTICCGQY